MVPFLIAVIIALIGFLTLTFTGCGGEDDGTSGELNGISSGDGNGGNTKVTFNSLTADGSALLQSTTQLMLTFSNAITDLSADDITLSGVTELNKGTLSGSGATYTLPISGFTAGGALSVAVVKQGYDISGSPKTVNVYYAITKAIEMVSIQGGTYTMGSPVTEPEHDSYEMQHSVTLSGFSMSKYLVTQAQWVAVMGAGEDRTDATYGKGDNYPVYNVSWYDAIVFCNKLSKKEGLNPVYSISGSNDPAVWITNNGGTIPTGSNMTWDVAVMHKSKNGYRLPTEAEWEYACRAGMTTPFNTGNNITTGQANYNGNYPYHDNAKGTYRGMTTPVGSFAPNAWRLYDMHGNLWEWCWDWYGIYANDAQTDPTGAVNGPYRVRRGGGFNSYGQYLRSAYRDNHGPINRHSIYIDDGLRLVRS